MAVLPTIVVTERGSYPEYTGNETIVPTYSEYEDAMQQQERLNGAINMLNTKTPKVPEVPYTPNLYSKVLGRVFDYYFKAYPIQASVVNFLGGTSNPTVAMLGADPHAETCIYTASSAFNRPTSGNKTFEDEANSGINGFQHVDRKNGLQIGDIVQMWGEDGNNLHHAGVITGFNKYGDPTITYSNGGQEEKDMKYDVDNWNELGEVLKYLRFFGNKNDKKNWTKEYVRKFGNKK